MKKIALMSFYESNSRYLHELSKKITEKKGIECVQICMYSSSVKYCHEHNLEYLDITKKVREAKCLIEADDIPVEFYNFHVSIFPELESDFLKVAKLYWSYYKNDFPWKEFTSILFIGDKRLYSSIGAHFARKNHVSTFFFEPCAYGTMIFDPQGVNCNMSISSYSLEEMNEVMVSQDIEKLYQKCISNPPVNKFFEKNLTAYYRKIHDVWQSIPPVFLRKSSKLELLTGEGFFESIPYLLSRLPFRKSNKKNKIKKLPQKFIFLALQVPNDVQIIENSDKYNSIEDMLACLSESIPSGYKLVVREHPMNKGRYSKTLYEIINSNDSVYIDNNSSMNELIDRSSLVVVINSTVGLEAAVRGAPVLTLGKVYYHQIVHCLTGRDNLARDILSSLNVPSSEDDVKLYMSFLFKNYLVKDNYKNETYTDLDNAVEKLCCN